MSDKTTLDRDLNKQSNADNTESNADAQEEDLDLSDVPMDEHEDVIHVSDDEEEEDEGDQERAKVDEESDGEVFDKSIQDEETFIYEKLFGSLANIKQVNLDEDEIQEEPEEELDDEERLRLLMDHLDPAQMSRYEAYRRTTVNKSSVKKVVNTVLNQSVSNNVAIVLGGVSKVFLGEIVERAKIVKERYDKANYLIKLSEKKELNDQLHKELENLKKIMEKDDSKIDTEGDGDGIVDITPIQRRIDLLKEELKKYKLKEINEKGPILPEHIREAWRLYQTESGTAPSGQWRRQGERDGLMFR